MISKKALALFKSAKENESPAIKPNDKKTGLGSGYLDDTARKIKKSKKTRQDAINEILKDL